MVLTTSPLTADYKKKSIGFQNQIHWIQESSPLDFRVKYTGFYREDGLDWGEVGLELGRNF